MVLRLRVARPSNTPPGPGARAEGPQPVPPAGLAWLCRAGEDPAALAAEWAAYPGQQQRLLTGDVVAAVDAPAGLGTATVVKVRGYGLELGPVAVEGERVLFLVVPGSLAAAAALLPAHDERGTDLDVRLRGAGRFIIAGPIDPAARPDEDDDCWWLNPPRSDPPPLPAADQIVRSLVATANAHLRAVAEAAAEATRQAARRRGEPR